MALFRRAGRDWRAVATPRIPRPELNGPASGRPVLAGHPLAVGPAPDIDAAAVIGYVQDYLRAVHPTYHLGPEFDPDSAFGSDHSAKMAAQDEIFRAHWRRTDDWFFGGVQGSGGEYDVRRTSRWEAIPTGERAWQVTWTATLDPGARVSYRGVLVGSFDDGLRLVEGILPEFA